ncbi:MAG: HlyD family secretion protein [Caulobacterales bacterium]
MNPQRLIIAVLGLLAVALTALIFLAPKLARPATLSGYVESEPLYLASPVAGTLSSLAVRRGDLASGGETLFTIDPRQLGAAREQAAQTLAAAQAAAVDARKGLRPTELAQLSANVAAAQANAREADLTYRRAVYLTAKGFDAPATLDSARASRDAAAEAVKAAQKAYATATLGQREDQIRQADAKVADAAAALAAAGARVSDLAPVSPGAARVEDTFFQPGEWVNANQPVVSLLPNDRITIRFFAPERQVARYRIGQSVSFACDGCASGLSAVISFVSPRPEFTPPVIYSLESRDALVFLVEARPAHPERLTPGLPVDVTPLGPAS